MAHIATATHWTYDQIGDLSYQEAQSLFDYWAKYPPTHISVGIQANTIATDKKPASKEELRKALAGWGSGSNSGR